MATTSLSMSPNTRTGVSNGVLGVLILIGTEIMFFSGLISSYLVNRVSSNLPWPPPGQPRLPVGITAGNTIILLLSGLLFYLVAVGKIEDKKKALIYARVSVLLGAVFLFIQGFEWIRLIGYGITVHSSLFGAFFYTLIGAHGLHVFGGILAIFPILLKKENELFDYKTLTAAGLYWYFVVLVWPLLYFLLYLL